MEIFTESAEQTQKVGQDFASDITKGIFPRVICLYGDLGSGKTTFIQGLAKGLGITERVLSPTFILMRQYPGNNFYHVDLYRINNEKEAEPLGLEEIWSDPQNILAIEWPEKITGALPEKRTEIYFEYILDNKRKITIK